MCYVLPKKIPFVIGDILVLYHAKVCLTYDTEGTLSNRKDSRSRKEMKEGGKPKALEEILYVWVRFLCPLYLNQQIVTRREI